MSVQNPESQPVRRSLPVFLIVMAGLVGCVGQTPIPGNHYYRLPVADSPDAGPTVLAGTLAVAPFEASGLYNDRAIIYIESRHPLQVNHYHYHYWVDSPAVMLQDHLITSLRKLHFADSVVRYAVDEHVAHVIAGRITHFERILDDKQVKVLVGFEIEYQVAGMPALHQEYQAEATAADETLSATVQAFGTALQDVYKQLTMDIRAINDQQAG